MEIPFWGGEEACEKEKRLSSFRLQIRIVSENLSPEREGLDAATVKNIILQKKILSRFHFVAAAEEKAEPQRLVSVCRKQHIPVNAVVQPAQCDFLFFALISTARLSGGVSTGGASSTAAIELRKKFPNRFPLTLKRCCCG